VQVTDRLRARGEVEYEIRSGADCRIRWARTDLIVTGSTVFETHPGLFDLVNQGRSVHSSCNITIISDRSSVSMFFYAAREGWSK
jgi:hypothetical protein